MPKVTGPLFSVEGMGSIGDGITFTRCPKGHRAILRPRHRDASTAAQSVVRSSFIAARSAWRTLSSASKAYYNAEGDKIHMSGYNFYIRGVLLGEIALASWVNGSYEGQVAASADDAALLWATSSWTFQLTRASEPMGRTSSTLKQFGAGMRWLSVTIPKGATILTAHVHLTCKTYHSGAGVKARIVGNLEPNAAAFSTATDYKNRRGTVVGGADNSKRTVAQVDYDPETTWNIDVEYTTPDITAVIQEIVNQEGWASGNALALFIDDHDDRTVGDSLVKDAYSYNGSAAKAPKLHITYKYMA